jgi:cytochrome c551/c552
MKQIIISIISAVCIFAISTAYADDGEAIFKSQGCMLCHKKESASKVNPSLTDISQAYQGKEEQLIK